MALLQWDDGFETGIPAADHEHGKLVNLVNNIHARWERRGERDVSVLFDRIVEIFKAHFEFEDRLARGFDNPQYAVHVRDHERLFVELRRIRERAGNSDHDTIGALAACIELWLADHIRNFDAPFYKALVTAS